VVEAREDVAGQLAELALLQGYEADDVIIEQGATDTDIFFIIAGKVIVTPNRRPDIVRAAGTHVGEMAAIDPAARRSATVPALQPTVVARVSEPDFSRLAKAYPFIWRHLARELSDRLRQRAAKVPARKELSRIFIASSREALDIATRIKDGLRNEH